MENIGFEVPESAIKKSHTVSIKIFPNNTYQLWIDKEVVVSMGDLRQDWDFLGEDEANRLIRIENA
jgi:hypothetical protein